MTIDWFEQLFSYPNILYGLITLLTIILIISLFIMKARCPDIINCTQSMANALVDGLTNSFSSMEGRNISSDLIPSNDPVWILGEKYSSLHDMEGIKEALRSKLWITYRRGFPKIGGNGPSSDFGWGCMLRCGQMVLAQALIIKHLGRHWRWADKKEMIKRGDYKTYLRILSLFLDKKAATYSIHQIAQMGASEGKPVGHWFGPNTVAQVLKKLATYDQWNQIVIHVCLDNMVVIEEIKAVCKTSKPTLSSSSSSSLPSAAGKPEGGDDSEWQDLILFIPLRLGLSEVNPLYFEPLKSSFRMKQTLGIIGGRPNHALYFIGYVGNEIIYLDPHTTQPVLDLDLDLLSKTDRDLEHVHFDDSSYHQENAYRMSFDQLDPSIALCFFFHSEEEFDSWCNIAHNLFIASVKQPLFELFKERPYPVMPLTPIKSREGENSDYDVAHCSSTTRLSDNFADLEKDTKRPEDDEFEVLGADYSFGKYCHL